MENNIEQPKELDRILWDIPRRIETDRLILRAPERGDGNLVNEVKNANLDHAKPWLPWAQKPSTVEEDEAWIRQKIGQWELNQDFPFLMFFKDSGKLLSTVGIHCRQDFHWKVRHFEIGYWIDKDHEGKGLVTEAVLALTHFSFDVLKANTVTIRAAAFNAKSRAVPERLGFIHTGHLQGEVPHPVTGEPMDLHYYSRSNKTDLPELKLKY